MSTSRICGGLGPNLRTRINERDAEFNSCGKMSSHTESRGQVVSLSSGSRYSISALAPRLSPPSARLTAPGSRAGGRRHCATRTARARARRPRGAMLSQDFSLRRPLPGAAKLFINIRPVGRNLDNFSPYFELNRPFVFPYNLAFLRANLAIGRKSQNFSSKN